MIVPSPPSLREFAPNIMGEMIAEALGAQASLTAVDVFSSWHEQEVEAAKGLDQQPHLAPWYRDLIPLQAPGIGEQYAFVVDLDRCSGCKACVTACHSLNGLDEEEGESFREVGLLLDPSGARGQQHITSACHHCLQPGCADGCPVLAYEKEADTGVVKHLDDQCIGCEYCVLKCPYDVPKYHHGKGIVRKCDLCVGRLRAGEAPACVQACPTKAISVTVVSTQPVETEAVGFTLPSAPDPAFTRPTTVYRSAKPLPASMIAGDAKSLAPEAAHWPLAATLVVSQVAFGTLWAGVAYHLAGHLSPNLAPHLTHSQNLAASHLPGTWLLGFLPLVVMSIALGLSILHLGRPLQAWKAWLNWRKSWLSREIIAFGGFAACAAAYALVGCLSDSSWANALATSLGNVSATPTGASISASVATSQPLLQASTLVSLVQGLPDLLRPIVAPIAGAAFVFSLLGLITSSMVYIDTPRAFWRRPATAWRFALTALGTGTLCYASLASWLKASLGGAISGAYPRVFPALTHEVTHGVTQSLTQEAARGLTQGVTEGLTQGLTQGVNSGITFEAVAGFIVALAIAAHALKWFIEFAALRHARLETQARHSASANPPDANAPTLSSPALQLQRSARILLGPKRKVWLARTLGGVLGILALLVFILLSDAAGSGFLRPALLSFAALSFLAADLLERHLFFTASASPRMPGTL